MPRFASSAVALLLVLATPNVSSAEMKSWTNPAGGLWQIGTNWDPGGVPADGDEVLLPNHGTGYTVTLQSLSPQLLELTVGMGATLDLNTAGILSVSASPGLMIEGSVVNAKGQLFGDVWVQPGGSFTTKNNLFSTLELNASTIRNDGVFTIGRSGPGAIQVKVYFQQDVTFVGNGEVQLLGQSHLLPSANTTSTIVNGPDHTIRGFGTIGMPLTNQGTLHAETFLLNAHFGTSTGDLRVSSGGTLSLEGLQHEGGSVHAVGGTILADLDLQGGELATEGAVAYTGSLAGANVTGPGYLTVTGPLAGIEVSGPGSLTTTGAISGLTVSGGSYHAGSSISNVTVLPGGEIRVLQTTTASGSLVNDGTVYVSGTLANSGATLSGSGILRLEGGNLSNGWTHPAGHTIAGRGSASVENHSTIIADLPGWELVLDLSGNEGTIEAVGGAKLRIDGTFTNTGTISATGGSLLRLLDGPEITNVAGGRIVADASNVFLSGTVGSIIRGGTIEGSSGAKCFNARESRLEDLTLAADLHTSPGGKTILANVTNDGTLSVAGTLEIASSATLQGAGNVRLEDGVLRGGTTPLTSAGHRLRGVGRVETDFINSGTVQPGSSPGTLRFDGDFEQTGSGRLEIELASTAPGGHDRLEIAGVAHLDGTVAASLIDGYMPVEGDGFLVISAASRSGQFAVHEGFDLGGGNAIVPIYNPSGDVFALRIHQGTVSAPRSHAPAALRLRALGLRGELSLDLPREASVDLQVHDVVGRRVWSAALSMPAGSHRIDAGTSGALAPGVYFARVAVRTAGLETRSARFVVAR